MHRNIISEENRLVVRIWTSKFSSGEDVGHISLHASHYISLWPGSPSNGGIKSFFEERTPRFIASPRHDIQLEGREPEYTICLYSLDREAISKKFEELKRGTRAWTLLGEYSVVNKQSSTTHSCASFARQILVAGNILDLIPDDYCSGTYSRSPDQLARLVFDAKRVELESHPETASYKFAGESEIPTENATSKCVIL